MAPINDFTCEDEDKVVDALESFFKADKKLLDLNASERSISHKLAEHLQKEFSDWNVDCEYNRQGEDPKRMFLDLFTDLKADDQEAKTVFPDIIIHKRNTDENLLVIEIKKSNNPNNGDKDIQKLKAFTDTGDEGKYKYKAGLFLVFDVEKGKLSKCEYYKNGKKDEKRSKRLKGKLVERARTIISTGAGMRVRL